MLLFIHLAHAYCLNCCREVMELWRKHYSHHGQHGFEVTNISWLECLKFLIFFSVELTFNDFFRENGDTEISDTEIHKC